MRATRPFGQFSLARVVLACFLSAIPGALVGLHEPSLAQAEVRVQDSPNFVVIQTDDQTREGLYAQMRGPSGAWAPVMPATRHLIADRGIRFENHYVTNPLCCPSRVSLLTGRYSQSHRIYTNAAPLGGWHAFRQSAAYRNNLATWLQEAGYYTSHVGKFINEYGTDDNPETIVPPGWSTWQTAATDNSGRNFYGYMMNVNGTIRGPFGSSEYGQGESVDPFGCLFRPLADPDCNHKTDLTSVRAVAEIRRAATTRHPFYIQVDYSAPHGDHHPPIGPEPTPRNYERAAMTPIPRPPSFDEADISDKPSFIRDAADRLDEHTLHRIRIEYRRSLESLRDVDDGVRRIIGELGRRGLLRDTYVMFTSDNGFFFGEHRLDRAKFLPYQPAVHMPFVMRGPGIDPGSKTAATTANIDIAPTVLGLANVSPRRALRTIEGRSMIPHIEDPDMRTRRPLLLESFAGARHRRDARALIDGPRKPGHATASLAAPPESYLGVLLGRFKYVEYPSGERELYDLRRDPYELQNEAANPAYFRVRGFLAHQLERLEGCRGAQCRITTNRVPRPDWSRLKLRSRP